MPEVPKLTAETIHLWQVHFPYFYPTVNDLKLLLNGPEQQRAARFLFDKHRLPYIVAQAHLRMILSQYLAITPASLEFHFGAYGKPYLNNSALQFNMSHSNEYALYAIALDQEIGIDIEFQRERTFAEGIVASQFSALESAQYQKLVAAHKFASFYKGWSCKEAFIKAIGMGLAFPLKDFSVDMDPRHPAKLIEIKPNTFVAEQWHLHLIEGPKNYSCALATQIANPILNYFKVPSL